MNHRVLFYVVMAACGVGFVLGQSRWTEFKFSELNFIAPSPPSHDAVVVDPDLNDTAAIDADTPSESNPDDDELIERSKSVLGTVKKVSQNRLQQPVVELGQKLFWDKRLSANGQVACASCHLPEDWGADSRRYSIDARGKQTKRNSQTVFNSALQPGLRWVADRKSAADQAEKSLTGSMGFDNADDLLPLLKKFDYAEEFQKAFPDSAAPLTPQNYGSAIEAYEQTLTTPAPFDHYLDGDHSALSPQQKKGLKLFLEIGCADCHSGPLLGGDDLQTFGVYRDYWEATGSEGRDAGLFESTHQEADRNLFRVSMLRNVAKTAPYFHDGSVAELSQAVQVMAKLQLDQALNEDQTADLVAFLESLTGQVPPNYRDPFAEKTMTESAVQPANDGWNLQAFGTMREAIGMGQHQGRVSLGELARKPHFFGVGALEGLNGEITIYDGKVLVSTVHQSGKVTTASDEQAAQMQATMLIGGVVSDWVEIEVQQSIQPNELDRMIGEIAGRHGLNIDRPFPFVVEGQLLDLHVHIINGACPVHARRNNLVIPQSQQPFDLLADELPGRVVGIFATNAAGRMTHPGSSVHAHLIFEVESEKSATGHLEQFGIKAGSTLKIPKGNTH